MLIYLVYPPDVVCRVLPARLPAMSLPVRPMVHALLWSMPASAKPSCIPTQVSVTPSFDGPQPRKVMWVWHTIGQPGAGLNGARTYATTPTKTTHRRGGRRITSRAGALGLMFSGLAYATTGRAFRPTRSSRPRTRALSAARPQGCQPGAHTRQHLVGGVPRPPHGARCGRDGLHHRAQRICTMRAAVAHRRDHRRLRLRL